MFWAGVGGGTAHYRCRTPGAALTRSGWDVAYVESDDSPLAADVVVLQRVVAPFVPELIRRLQVVGSTVVYDVDDWYDAIPDYNPASRTVTGDTLAMLHDALRAADLITCSTPELAEGYARFGPTAVLPNYLDPDLWGDAHRYRRPRTEVHVGWMGDAKARIADLALLRDWLPGWLDRNPGVKFVGVGSGPELFDYLGVGGLTPSGERILHPYEHLPALLSWVDVGLVPLVHNRFNQAKSWCKGLEYNAAGAAVVASGSREYRSFVQPGVNGFLAHKDWPSVLDRTLDRLDDLRAGARRIAEEHMIDRHIGQWVDAWQRVPVCG